MPVCFPLKVPASHQRGGSQVTTLGMAQPCTGTAAAAEVHPEGCSLAQFCSLIDVSTGAGKGLCNASDWQNDEPLAKSPEDCRVQDGVRVPR
jgi:hypothetical protein